MSTTQFILYPILGVIGIILLVKSIVIVRQQEAKVIERLGKFNRVLDAGLHLKIPFLERVAHKLSLRIEQLEVSVETKTKDNVFVTLPVAIQFQVLKDKVFEAAYMLDDSEAQITSYVFDVVRSKVPEMDLDDVFENKDEIAQAVQKTLTEQMLEYGYKIVAALVTDISPDEKVREAMNEINAQKRLREAAEHKGEGEKILVVKEAEAFAESKKLQGEGIANERRAIAQGIKDSVDLLKDATGVAPGEALATLTLTQQMDTLREIGANNRATVLVLPSGPGAVTDFMTQFAAMNEAVVSAGREN